MKPIPRWFGRVCTSVVLLCAVAACYTQTPLLESIPAPETRVVALVTDSGVIAMANALGPGSREVEGIVAAADAAAWDLQMLRVDYRGGTSTTWNRELVRFPRAALTNATVRRMSKGRSWLVAGLITSSALLAAHFAGFIGGGEDNSKPPPPPN